MDLIQIRHFLAVASHGSLSRAADALNMSQPGLTKSIRGLEGRLGVPLFARKARGVELTAFGEALLDHARAVDMQLRDARAEIKAMASGEAGLVVIGAGPAWLTRHLPRAVLNLVTKRPGLRFRIVGGFNGALMPALMDGKLDMIVAALPDGDPLPGLAHVPLTRDLMTIVAGAGHPLRNRKGLRLVDLAPWPWILPTSNVLSRNRLSALFLARGLTPPVPTIEYDSLSYLLASLRESEMLTFANRQLLSLPEARDLATLEVEGGSMERQAGIIHRKGEPSRACRAMIEELRLLVAEEPIN